MSFTLDLERQYGTTGHNFTGTISGNFTTMTAGGAGFLDAVVASNIRKFDNEIITTILIDLDEGPMAAQESGKVIGETGSSVACDITRITAAKNGYVYKAELCCIETPNAAANLDLVHAASALTPGTTSGSYTILINGGVSIKGDCDSTESCGDLDGRYLHLATGGTDGTADYTAGKFVIKLYGANF